MEGGKDALLNCSLRLLPLCDTSVLIIIDQPEFPVRLQNADLELAPVEVSQFRPGADRDFLGHIRED